MSGGGRGLFVDLDGTLAATIDACRDAYDRFLGYFGAVGSAIEFDSLNGPPLRHVVNSLRATHDLPGSEDELLALYERQLRDAHLSAPPADGASGLLERARAQDYRVAVVTSASHDFATTWLAGAKLARLVDLLVSGDEVRHGKPDPEPYLTALAQTRCAASSSLAVEDSVAGATAALAADLPTYMIGGGAPGAIATHPRFRGRVTSLREIAGRL